MGITGAIMEAVRLIQLKFFIFILCVYLFLAALGLHCCVQASSSWGSRASPCGGFSCYGARAVGCEGFRSCSSWAPEHRLSSCGPRLSCSMACGTFQTRIEPIPCIGRQILNHWTIWEALCQFLIVHRDGGKLGRPFKAVETEMDHSKQWVILKSFAFAWWWWVNHQVVSSSSAPWIIAHQDPLSMRFSRQEYWSGLPWGCIKRVQLEYI